MSSLTTPSAQFLKDLADLGTALNTGNLTDAQSVFKTTQNDQPDNMVETMSKVLANAISTGTSDPFWMEEIVNFGITVTSSSPAAMATTGSSSSTSSAASSDGTSASSGGTISSVVTAQEGFNGDLIALEGVIKESNANIGDYLQTQGYSAAVANATASALNKTDILGMLPGLAEAIGSAAGNNNMGDLTISNSSAFAHISSTSDNSGTGAVDNTSMSSMNDMFSYSLTGAYISLSNENTQTVDNSGSIVSRETTLTANKTAATLQESMFIQLENSINSASIVTMNQTKNIAENFLGNSGFSSTSDSGASRNGSDANYKNTSVYA